MADVVSFEAIRGGRQTGETPAGPLIDQETVDLLRDLLAQAEAGTISGVAIATLGAERPEGGVEDIGTVWTGAVRRNVHGALGAVTHLQLRMHAELYEVKR